MIADFTENLNWRGGREAEGAPLLREYAAYTRIGGSNPPFSAIIHVAR